MKKIMIVHTAIGYGGSTLSLLDLIDMLQESYELVLCLPRKSAPQTFQMFKEKKIKLIVFDKPPVSYTHYSGINAPMKPGFWKGLLSVKNQNYWLHLIISEQPAAVMLNSSVLSPMAYTIKKAGAKSICYNRETHKLSYFGILDKIMKHFLEKCNLVFYISNDEREHFRLINPPSLTIADILNEQLFSPKIDRAQACSQLGLNQEDFIVLFVGGGAPIKGLDIALQAMWKLRNNKKIKLLVLGEIELSQAHISSIQGMVSAFGKISSTKYVKSCLRYIKNMDNVVTYGVQEDLATFYSASDVLVFPSRSPHQARPAYEAGHYGIPVIISDYPETSEFVKDHINGLYFIPNDADDLSNKILWLYRNPKQRHILGENNKNMTQQLHSFKHQKRIIFSAIEVLLG